MTLEEINIKERTDHEVKMIDYLGVKVPEPMREHPKQHALYWYRSPDGSVSSCWWTASSYELSLFKFGIYQSDYLCRMFCDAVNPVLMINQKP